MKRAKTQSSFALGKKFRENLGPTNALQVNRTEKEKEQGC
jgi:hypothetical protein